MLPQDFINRMQKMLGNEYNAFLESYENEKYQALRLNPLKVKKQVFEENTCFHISEVPWAENGYYYEKEDYPGKHPYHDAGVYYIQEPSAMAPAEYLEVKPKERVLDLCAAPGGKSTQLGAALKGEGLLICNEIHPARAKILSENIERMGIKNAIVTNETPAHLAAYFPAYFDKILVDAPCSGEGMFRKNEDACTEWSLENVALCAKRQDEILDEAASMLRPGGRLVYSTCTFAPAENEGSISRFLERHSDFGIIPVEKKAGMSNGVPDWIENPAKDIEQTIRLWPHKLKGEGHYLAVLQKEGIHTDDRCGTISLQQPMKEKDCKECIEFLEQFVPKIQPKNLFAFGEQIYQMPEQMPDIAGLKVLRPGLHLGTRKKNRFEPAHALALALSKEDVRYSFDLSSESNENRAYLNGQTLSHNGEKGWYLITVDGYSIGWGKLAGGIIKNHYPKGLRKNL